MARKGKKAVAGAVSNRDRLVRYAEQPERIGSINPVDGITLGEEVLVSLNCVYRDDAHGIFLYQGDCLEVLDAIAAKHPDGCFDMIFADPPYFLSNGGITCHAGKMVKVDKGGWDKSRGPELNHEFNTEWLRRCQRVLKPNGTIWVTGTHHVIFSVGYLPLQEVIEQVLARHMQGNSEEENADLAERLSPSIATLLEEAAAQDRAEGIAPLFEISREGKSIYFRAFTAPDNQILKDMRALDPAVFESFCAEILRRLGAESRAEGGPHDGGVDFVCVSLQLGEMVEHSPRASKALVLGQAKRHGERNKISLNDLRQFIGAATLRLDALRISSTPDAGLLSPVIYAY
jgi:hypothetical protein